MYTKEDNNLSKEEDKNDSPRDALFMALIQDENSAEGGISKFETEEKSSYTKEPFK